MDKLRLSMLLIYVCTFLLVRPSDSCYFTNCPWGGKRSVYNDDLRKCPKCANGNGTCFGPRICCIPSMGCLLDTKLSKSCEQEDMISSRPCETYGNKCEKVKYGRCASVNLCCNAETCSFDSNCNLIEQETNMFSLNLLKNQANLNVNEDVDLLEEEQIIQKAIKYLIKLMKQKQKQEIKMNDSIK